MNDIKLKEVAHNHNGYSIDSNIYYPPPNTLSFNIHWHDMYEIIGIVSGTLLIKNNSETFTAIPGDIAVFSPRNLHSGMSGANGCVYKTIKFSLDTLFDNSLFEISIIDALNTYRYKIKPFIRDKKVFHLFDQCYNSSKTQTLTTPLKQKAAACLLLSFLMDNYLEENKAESYDLKFNIVINYINEHFVEQISADILSKKFSYSKSYLCRKFRSVTGTHISKYIHILRIEYAQNLISNSPNLALSEVASICGYNSPNYFSNTFHHLTGMTPLQWKNITSLSNHNITHD